MLPFENLSTRPESSAFVDELYDEVLDQLGALTNVYVLGRESVLSYANSTLAPDEIARELSVGSVVEATIEDADRQQLLITIYYDIRGGGRDINAAIRGRSGFYRQARDDAATMAAYIVRSLEVDFTFRPGRETDRWMAERIAGARVIILDVSRSDAERLRALYQLPNGPGLRGAPFATEAKSGAVAVAAAQMAIHSDDPRIRAAIWRLMSGVGDPYLLQPLLYSVANDPDHTVRGEAARTLFDFVEEPGVREALEYARDNDATIRVRNEARLALLPDKEWSQVLEDVALDTTLSEVDRASILRKFYDRGNESRIVPGDFAVAMWQLTRETHDRRVWSDVWRFLRSIDYDSSLVPPLLDALADDPDPRVRMKAAELLHKFRDQTEVREALAEAQANDTSRDVRRQAASPF